MDVVKKSAVRPGKGAQSVGLCSTYFLSEKQTCVRTQKSSALKHTDLIKMKGKDCHFAHLL